MNTLQTSFWWTLHVATIALAILTLLTFGARFDWRLDLLCHFRAQFFLCAALAALVYAAGGHKRAAVLATVLMAYQAWELAPAYVRWLPATDSQRLTRQLRVVSFNVYIYNDHYAEVVDYIRSTDADVVAFYEVSAAWARGLEPLGELYPHVYSYPSEGSYGLLVVSRVPLSDVQLETPSGVEGAVFSAQAPMAAGSPPVSMFVLHPPPPISADLAHTRDATFEFLAAKLKHAAGPVLVVGDFNCTRWSPRFVDLGDTCRLTDARLGRGLQPSWPTWLPVFMQLPIDHCLTRGGVQVLDLSCGPACGSDHRPIVVDLAISAEQASKTFRQ